LGLLWEVALFGYFTSGLLRRSYDSKAFPHSLAIHMYCFAFLKKIKNKKRKKFKKLKNKKRKIKTKKKRIILNKVFGKWCCV